MKFEEAKQEIATLRQQTEAGEIASAYLDEVDFAQVHPNRSAWTPVGEQHHLEASRGKRLKVIGAFLSTGQFFRVALWCAVNALRFVGFLGLLDEKVDKPLTIILDNATLPRWPSNTGTPAPLKPTST